MGDEGSIINKNGIASGANNVPFDLKDVIQKNSNNKSPGTANRPKNLDITNQFNDVIANQNEVIDYTYDFDVSDNLIPNDREASFANIVQATVVETSARSVRDPSIGSKFYNYYDLL